MTKIIAELCQNHNGNLSLMKEMVWAAKENGADYAKIQTIFADDLTSRPEFEEGRQENGAQTILKRPHEAERNRMKPLELSEDAHRTFLETCEQAEILPLTTVFARSRIPFVQSLGFKTVKVASIDCASFPMIRELRDRFDFLIISTGATFSDEVAQTASILKGKPFAFLHCVSIYPTPLEKLNLDRIHFLRKFTPNVGFSDHSSPARDGLKAALAAMALGAQYIERHFTLLNADQTRDGPVSIDPGQLAELAKYKNMPTEKLMDFVQDEIPEFEKMRGVEDPDLGGEEWVNRAYYRGRFASRVNGQFIYNWEERPVF